MQINPVVFQTIGVFVVIFIASFLIWILVLGVFYLYFLAKKVKKEVFTNALISGLNAWAISSFIKLLIPSLRPYMFEGTRLLTTTYHLDSSFPSSHAALAFAVAFSIFLRNKTIGLVYIGGAILVGAGRILSHAHFFVDVFAGAILGIIIAIVVDSISSKSKK